MTSCQLRTSGTATIVTPPPHAFRNAESRNEVHQFLEDLITKGSRELIIDLSQTKPPFDDEGSFGSILHAFSRLQETGSGYLVVVPPGSKIRSSFEFEPIAQIIPMAQNVGEALQMVEESRKERELP